MAKPVKFSCDGIETMHSFLYLGSEVDSIRICETAVTVRRRAG